MTQPQKLRGRHKDVWNSNYEDDDIDDNESQTPFNWIPFFENIFLNEF